MSSSPSSIFLGFALEMDQNELFSLDRQFLPLGKIGGFPAWLDPVNVPKAEELACSNCQSPMAFILQIYCPGQTNQPHAFHRVLYIFACRNGQCSKTNDASNFAAFRCQLPRQNPFYSPTESLNPTLVGDVPDPFFNAETFAKLCIVCGARAEKRCSKCSKRMYCSKAHQIIDWRTIHKEECPQQKDYSAFNSTEKWELRQKHGFTFREYGMEMEATAAAEDGQNNQRMDGSDDEEDEEEELSDDGIREEKKRIRKFEELAIANGITSKDIEGLEENRRDVAFKQFNQAIGEEPEQVIRYWRGGKPQLATDFSPAPKNIPQCQLCQCPRHFEFQLMPHLLQLIGVDSVAQSLDWATLLVYTCSNDCPIPEGYEREYAFKQDFVMAPKEDEEK